MNKNSTRYFSNKQEKHIAKELGGKQTANSGATPFYKVLTSCNFYIIVVIVEQQHLDRRQIWKLQVVI